MPNIQPASLVVQPDLDGSLVEKVLSASERVGELYVNFVRDFHKMTPKEHTQFEELRDATLKEFVSCTSELEKLAVEYHKNTVELKGITIN